MTEEGERGTMIMIYLFFFAKSEYLTGSFVILGTLLIVFSMVANVTKNNNRIIQTNAKSFESPTEGKRKLSPITP